MKELNDFDKKLIAQHQYKSYRQHFKRLYYLIEFIFKPILLCVSIYLSTCFLGNYFGSTDFSFIAGLVGAVVVAGFIYYGTDDLIGYNQSQNSVDVLLVVLTVACYGLNISFDYNSADFVGKQLTGNAPEDTKTANIEAIYKPKIEALQSQIDEVESANFYWCGLHKVKDKHHECPKNHYYVHPTKDIEAVANVKQLTQQKSDLQTQLTEALSNANKTHSMAITDYDSRLTNNRKYMRYTSLICSTLFFLLSVWVKRYGLKGVSEITSAKRYTSNPKRKTNDKNKPTKRKKKNKRKNTKTVYDDEREELTEEELAEELETMRENERRANEKKP